MDQSGEAAKPAEPAAIEPPKPEKRRPFWRGGGAFWSMAALTVFFCCLMNSCGSVSDGSATESMPDVVGMDYAHVHQALADCHDVDYIDLKGNPTLSGVATKQSPKAARRCRTPPGSPSLSTRKARRKSRRSRNYRNGWPTARIRTRLRSSRDWMPTSCPAPSRQARTILPTWRAPSGVASPKAPRTSCTDAIVDNGGIDLVVDTVAHHNRELASQQIPAMCEAAGKQAHPYGFKVPLFSDNSGVVFSNDTN